MRIASGGVQHETNTFSHIPTKLEDFVRDSDCGPELSGGETLFNRYRGTGSIHGGYIAGAEAEGAELIPLISAKAYPSGIVEQSAFDHILSQFLERLESAPPVDGILLDLHGAMVTDQLNLPFLALIDQAVPGERGIRDGSIRFRGVSRRHGRILIEQTLPSRYSYDELRISAGEDESVSVELHGTHVRFERPGRPSIQRPASTAP